jgi:hypothetical protein
LWAKVRRSRSSWCSGDSQRVRRRAVEEGSRAEATWMANVGTTCAAGMRTDEGEVGSQRGARRWKQERIPTRRSGTRGAMAGRGRCPEATDGGGGDGGLWRRRRNAAWWRGAARTCDGGRRRRRLHYSEGWGRAEEGRPTAPPRASTWRAKRTCQPLLLLPLPAETGVGP